MESNHLNLDQWIKSHGHSFVAHATRNHGAIFKNKNRVLRCAEEVLRVFGNCEHEKKVQTNRVISRIDFLPTEGCTLPCLSFVKRSKKTQQMHVVTLVPHFARELASSWKLEDNPDYKKKDCGLFLKFTSKQVEKKPEKYQSSFDSDRDIQMPEDPCTPEIVLVKLRFNLSLRMSVSVQSDERDHRIIDNTLRAIYQYCLEKQVNEDRLTSVLGECRDRIFSSFNTSIESTIRTSKNLVAWSYGDVAIVMGNPEQKISSKFPIFGDKTFEDPATNGHEFPLKRPFQTSEGFYQEPLDSEENLILGPKAILDQHRQDPDIADSVKARFVNIESLTPEQKRLFNISQ